MVFKWHRAHDIMLLQMTTNPFTPGFLTLLTLYNSDLPVKIIIAINNTHFKNTIKAHFSETWAILNRAESWCFDLLVLRDSIFSTMALFGFYNFQSCLQMPFHITCVRRFMAYLIFILKSCIKLANILL